MSQYTAPLRDLLFLLEEIAGLEEVARLPGNEEVSLELVSAILEEAGKFAAEVLTPLNRVGDAEGCRLVDEGVRTATGWKDAYAAFYQNGWTTLALPQEFGGQGLPKLVSCAIEEMWGAANLSFSLLPLLTKGAIEALLTAGTNEVKQKYVPRMVAGTWTGTMNLTEPQAGSDLAAVRCRAEPNPDGSYRLYGQKIFITYGDHDAAENIVHLVLARLPDAPPGVKGISLFVCPKYLVNRDGSLGARNDVQCVSLEHKLGIHASPTAVMAFGDQNGAIAEIVGQPNRGLEYMFIMMNEARFGVGLQGVAVAESAYQLAVAYARERIQGRDAATGANNAAIIRHPDVQRMLLTMRAKVMASRSLALSVAAMFDRAHRHPDPLVAARNQRHVDLLIPIVKAWSTDIGNEAAYLGVQIHGGMGFIEETGAAQFMRDARILPIYEGTNGIQAIDLTGRKLQRDRGEALAELIGGMRSVCAELEAEDALQSMANEFAAQLDALQQAAQWIVSAGKDQPNAVLAVASPFLQLMGIVCGSWQMARIAAAASRRRQRAPGEAAYLESLIGVARFYFANIAVDVPACLTRVCQGGASVTAFDATCL